MQESHYTLLEMAKSHQDDMRRQAEARRLLMSANSELQNTFFARFGRLLRAVGARAEVTRAIDNMNLYERIAQEGAMAEVERQAKRTADCH